MTFLRRLLSSLGFRLALGFALIAAISAGATGAVTTWSARDNILEAEQNRLIGDFNRMFAELPNDIGDPYLNDTPNRAQFILDGIRNQLRGPMGAEIPGTSQFVGNLSPDAVPESIRTASVPGNQPLYLRTRDGGSAAFSVAQAKEIQFYTGAGTVASYPVLVYASYPLNKQEQQINGLTTQTALLTLSVGVAAAFVGVLLSRQVLRPITALRRAVDRFGRSPTPVRLRASGVRELGGLIDSFNHTSGQLHRTVAELTESEKRARRFVADVSHELRTPTAAMVAAADTLDNPATAPEQLAQASRVTASAARRLAKLTEDLLEISRFDAGQIALQPVWFDAVERLGLLIAERGWPQVSISAAEELRVRLDARRFDVIAANLIGNALSHGGAPVDVLLDVTESRLRLEVVDHGTGIAAEDLPLLFDRFFKSDQSRSRGGTGLGLALVAENTALLGGSVQVQSRPGRTVFTVELPFAGDAEE